MPAAACRNAFGKRPEVKLFVIRSLFLLSYEPNNKHNRYWRRSPAIKDRCRSRKFRRSEREWSGREKVTEDAREADESANEPWQAHEAHCVTTWEEGAFQGHEVNVFGSVLRQIDSMSTRLAWCRRDGCCLNCHYPLLSACNNKDTLRQPLIWRWRRCRSQRCRSILYCYRLMGRNSSFLCSSPAACRTRVNERWTFELRSGFRIEKRRLARQTQFVKRACGFFVDEGGYIDILSHNLLGVAERSYNRHVEG